MSLRFQSALQVDSLPDEALDNQFEVIMPSFNIKPGANNLGANNGGFNKNMLTTYTPIVEDIRFGVRNFKTATRRVRTGWINVPEDIENYNTAEITMFCSSNMLTQYYLNAWKNLIFNSEGEYYNPMSEYKRNIEVFFYGSATLGIAATPILHYTLRGCCPVSQDQYKLKYSSDPKRLVITQTFSVDSVVYDNSVATKAVYGELLTNPSSLIDKATSALATEIGNQLDPTVAAGYSLASTYE